MTPLVLQVSMGGGDRLPSGDPYAARLPSYFIKKERICKRKVNNYCIIIHPNNKYNIYIKTNIYLYILYIKNMYTIIIHINTYNMQLCR